MISARREGLLWALLYVASLGTPLAAAQDSAPETPEAPEAPEDDAPEPDAPDAEPAEEDGDEWMTEDVAGSDDEVSQEDQEGQEAQSQAEQETEAEEGEDVDEIVIEYDETGEADKVTDAEGREIEDVATPVVSKAVKVQDPDDLEPGADKETGIQGQVVSRSPKKVLPDAPVLAKGKEDGRLRSTLTDERGRYRLYLPPGRYTLRSYYDLYHGARWDNILVTRGAFKRVNFVLDPISEKDAGVQEQEVIYLADTTSEAAQIALRKEATGIADAISSEEIKRAGDSTAKGAVTRVVGVTVDDKGRIIIRGLADRYNQILLNGMPIPGVDPDIPSVKLDIFPTDVVSNLTVKKVPEPNLPGAFAGGLLLIDTTNYPTEQKIKAGASFGVNSISTFRKMPTYRGGKTDWLGFDDGARAPSTLLGSERLELGRAGTRYRTLDQTSQVARGFSDVWNPRERVAAPKLGLKVSAGNSGDFKKEGRRGGYLLSFLYDYEDKIETGFNKRFTYDGGGNSDTLIEDFDYREGKQEVLWATFGSGFVDLNRDNALYLTTLFSRTSEDQTILQLGGAQNQDFIPESKNSFNFIGRSVLSNQLSGDHRNLGDTKVRLRWTATGGIGRREEPDRRQVTQTVETQAITGATRFFSDLGQYFVGGKTNVRFPVYQAFEKTAYFSAGVESGYQDRSFDARRFTQQGRGGTTLIGDPETVFGPSGLGRLSSMREVTNPEDSYLADNLLAAGFVMLETPMAPWLTFSGLLRFEAFRQRVNSSSPFADDATPVQGTDRTDLDPLPSANFNFRINDEMFVRLGYGMTVVRPAIRELAPFDYLDFLRGWQIRGNPNLQRTRVQNAEARYEYYFGATDLIAATAFGKYFTNPIEFVIISQVNGSASYRNADTAWLVGGELELRLGFGRFSEKLDRFFFAGSVAVMGSQTQLPEGQGIAGRLQRRLFNQSPFVTNLSLRFDDPDAGVLVALVYNAFGSRIVEAGSPQGGDVIAPDVFDQTQHLLDLIVRWKVSEHANVGFKWKNIAFARRRYKQGNEFTFLENRGTTVSISAEYSY